MGLLYLVLNKNTKPLGKFSPPKLFHWKKKQRVNQQFYIMTILTLLIYLDLAVEQLFQIPQSKKSFGMRFSPLIANIQ